MKRYRIALVVLSLLSIIGIVLMEAFFQAIQEGKIAKDWMGVTNLLMAGAAMGNVFLAYRYARNTHRQAGLWALGAFLLPVIIPLLLAFLPVSSSKSVEVPQGNKKAIPTEVLSDNRRTGERIACKACGAMISPTTANRTGGLCMPCSKGTRYIPSLIEAVNSGDKEQVAMSIANGADANTRDNQGGTALIISAYSGNNDIVAMLLDHGAIIDAKEYNTGKTALIYAVEKAHKDTIELLIQKGGNVNEVDDKGNAAIMFANSETAEFLIRNGANVNTTNCFGYTPLQFFRERGWEKMISILETARNPSSRDAEILDRSISSDETFLNSTDKTEYKNALTQIDDQSVLNELLENVREREKIILVLRKIKSKSIIEKYAQEHPDNGIRITAIKKLKNPDLLAQIAIHDKCNGARMAAVANIIDTVVLEQISQDDSHLGVRETARKVLGKSQKFKKAASSTETKPVAEVAGHVDAHLSSGKMQKTLLDQLLDDKPAETRSQVNNAFADVSWNFEFAVSVSVSKMQKHMDDANEKGFIAWCNEDGKSAIIYGAGLVYQDDFTNCMIWLNNIRVTNDVALAHFMATDGEKMIEIK